MNVFVITSSISGGNSASNQLVRGFIDNLVRDEVAMNIVMRDVAAEPLPHLSEKSVGGVRGEARTLTEYAAQALSDHLIEELEAADLIVIGSPMHNFAVASTLKSWFDYVLRAGRTFQYGPEEPQGLLKGKRAVVVETQGGAYSEGPSKAMDSQEPYLRTMLGFIGIEDVTFIRAERLSLGTQARDDAVSAASKSLRQLASSYRQAA